VRPRVNSSARVGRSLQMSRATEGNWFVLPAFLNARILGLVWLKSVAFYPRTKTTASLHTGLRPTLDVRHV
jgi:hypothetical protein